MPKELLDLLANTFITSESDGSTKSYAMKIKFETLTELQEFHQKLVIAVRDRRLAK